MYVHATFLVLVGYVALAAYGHRRLWDDAARSVVFVVVFFGVVVLHDDYKPVAVDAYEIPTDATDPYELDVALERK